MNTKPLEIGEIVTAINDLSCCDDVALEYDGQDVQVVGPEFLTVVDDPAAPNGFRFRGFYQVRAKDGAVLYCQRHELRRRHEGRDIAEREYASLIKRLTIKVMA
jgi:hypothetical protein